MFIFQIGVVIGLLVFSGASDWGYDGESGPQNWQTLFPKSCSGHHQSPIDINTTQTVYNPQLKDIVVFFDPPAPDSKFYLQNNGHAVQVNTEGKFYVSNGGLPNIYRTAQFHFHWGHHRNRGSEHTIDGHAAPIEMHIVNWNSDRFGSIAEAATEPEGLAVLGVLFQISEHDNPVLDSIVGTLLAVRDPDLKIKEEIPVQSIRAFLPPSPEKYYRYQGSLTTPNCFESVTWTVFKEKQTISKRQLRVFRQVLKPKHHKRHKRNTKTAEETVLDELGIKDNPVEKEKLRNSLEAKMQADAPTAGEPVIVQENQISAIDTPVYETHVGHENTTEQKGVADHGHQGNTSAHNETETKAHSQLQTNHTNHVDSHQHSDNNNIHEEMDVIRQLLVDNFRPVQPLHGREVFRSFPFLDDSETHKPSAVATHHSPAESKSADLNLLFSKSEDGHSPLNIKVVRGEKEMMVEIPPADAGKSHVEVTLDIDANTVVNITAMDKNTGRKQHIVIHSSEETG